MGIMRRFDINQLPTGSYSITGSFSGSFFGNGNGLFTGSFSGSVSSNLQEITDNGATTTNAITASGLQTSVLTVDTQTSISGTLDITGSAQLNNSPIVTEAILYPFTASYYVDSSSFDTRILNNSSSIDLLSGSFIAFSGSYLTDSSSFDTRILANSSSISLLSGSYLTDSASFDTRITNNSASIDILSGSFIAFSSSYLIDSASFDTRILNNSSSIDSLSGSYLTDSASFDTRIINNSSSISLLSGSFIGFSGSYIIDSASFDIRILDNSSSISLLSGSYLQDSSSFDTRILNNSSSISLLSGSYLTDSSSFDTRILNNSSSIDLLSGSFTTFSGSYLTDSSSFDTRITNNSSSISLLSGSYLNDSASFDTRILNNSASIDLLSGSYLTDSSSFDTRILNNSSSISTLSGSFIGFSGSYVIDSSSFDARITNNSSSIDLLSGSFIGFSGSYINDSSSFDTRILTNSSSIATVSSSLSIFSGSYVLDSASFDTRILSNSSSISTLSSSFDIFTQIYNTGSFTGSFTGSLFGTASWAVNAQTASYVLPLNQDVLINGSLNVTSSLTASGLIYPSADNGEFSFIQTDGNGNLSLQYVNTLYEVIINGELTTLTKGTPVYVSGSIGANSVVYRADAADPAKMPVIYISADNIAAGDAGRGIVLGLITGINTTGFPPGTEIFAAVGGGYTATRPTGSAIVQVLGIITKEGNGGQGVVLNPGPANLPNLPSGSVWVGNSGSFPTAVLTSSLSVASASFAVNAQTASFAPNYTLTASFNAFTSSYNTGSFTGSFIGDGSQLTGIVSSKWSGSNPISRDSDVEITGSFKVAGQTILYTTGSGTLTVQGSGSAQPIFLVTGSIGELLSVTDQDDPNEPLLIVSGSAGQLLTINSTSLLQIYNSSSNSVFKVNNAAEIIYGVSSSIFATQLNTITTTSSYTTIYNIQTGSYSGAFINYTVVSSSNARAGQLMSVWNSGTASYTETTTTDIGDTSQIAFDVIMTGSVAQIAVSASSTTGWQVKTALNIL
jgi:hypothetical protein